MAFQARELQPFDSLCSQQITSIAASEQRTFETFTVE
jgi:hypothetical protein